MKKGLPSSPGRRKSRLAWDDQAGQALKSAPVFARPLIRKKVEERVRRAGGDRVTLADFQEAEACFKAAAAGKTSSELASMLPRENRAGVEMTVIEACRGQLAGCPNALIDALAWREVLMKKFAERDISERLRARVTGDKVLFHHKLRVSLAGCPNGCSRPQIADLALVGFVRPRLTEPEHCLSCGQCAEACPDGAVSPGEQWPVFDRELCLGCKSCSQACPEECISLSQPAARVLMGGKLGRHPRLAQPTAQAKDADQAADILVAEVAAYLEQAEPGERFAAWRLRARDDQPPDAA